MDHPLQGRGVRKARLLPRPKQAPSGKLVEHHTQVPHVGSRAGLLHHVQTGGPVGGQFGGEYVAEARRGEFPGRPDSADRRSVNGAVVSAGPVDCGERRNNVSGEFEHVRLGPGRATDDLVPAFCHRIDPGGGISG